MTDHNQTTLVDLTSEVVAAYVAKNHLQPSELPDLIASVHVALGRLGKPMVPVEESAKLVPPVSIRKSVTNDYLVSMENGKRYKSLKRHLKTYGLTPNDYRAKWGLPHNYPMVAPTYAAKRSELARTIGLRRKRQEGADEG